MGEEEKNIYSFGVRRGDEAAQRSLVPSTGVTERLVIRVGERVFWFSSSSAVLPSFSPFGVVAAFKRGREG